MSKIRKIILSIYGHRCFFLHAPLRRSDSICLIILQDPNEDSEWNDVLRQKGILPPKPKEKEITEADIVQMLESTIQEKSGK